MESLVSTSLLAESVLGMREWIFIALLIGLIIFYFQYKKRQGG